MGQNARLALWVPSDEAPALGNVIAAEGLSTPQKVVNTRFSNASGLPDAPSDGTLYARQDAAWTAVPAAGLVDAPADGKTYARSNAIWIESVTKSGMDSSLAAKLNLAGGTMTGPLILSGDAGNALGAVTKQQMDAAIGAGLPAIIDGGTF